MPEPTVEALVHHFKASVSLDPKGKYRATAVDFPGVVTTGASSEEALAALETAISRHLESSATVALEAVHEEAREFVPYAGLSLGERLYLATNLDAVLVAASGRRGEWKKSQVTQQGGEMFSVFEGDESADPFGGGESSTQIQALTSFKMPGGELALYAGTNLKGLVYVLEGEEWRPAFSTGEEQVHAVAGFGGQLYAGTSPSGRIYRWNGKHAEMVHQAQQLGITALAVHDGWLYAGTYPEGLILRSEDGELWEIVCRTRAKLVSRILSGPGHVYAAVSHPAGGAIFRSGDGLEWERVFFSERDVNVYDLASFGGRLFAGTGEAGRLYASRDGAKWEVALQSSEAALRVVASHQGRLFIGCERRGVVYRTAGTEAPAPVVREVSVGSLTSSRAILEWATDVPCSAQVQYGAGPVRDQVAANPTLSRRHRVVLDGLKAGEWYSYLITARSAEGTEAHHLSEDGFRTPVLGALELASPTHADEALWYPTRDVEVRWSALAGSSRYVVRMSPQRVTNLTLKDHVVTEPVFHARAESDGAYFVAVAGVDEAGNVGDPAVRMVRCDTTVGPPAATAVSHPDPMTWYGSPVVELEASGADDASGPGGFLFAIGRVGEAWEQLAFQSVGSGIEQTAGSAKARWTLPRLPDGTWEIYVRFRDAAGNESAPAATRVQIDTGPPAVGLEPVPELAKAGELTLAWSARDERSGIGKVEVQQRRGEDAAAVEWETVYEGKGASIKVEGEDGARVWFRIVATDRAGNRGAAEAPHAVLFDGSPPAPVTVLEVASQAGGDIALRWAPVEDALSSVAKYHVHRASEPGRLGVRIGTVAASIQEYVDEGGGLAHGSSYHYRVVGEDAVGNVAVEGHTVGAVCDKEATPPALTSATHPPDQWTTHTEAVVEWTAPVDDTGIREYLWRLDRNPASSLIKGVDDAIAGPPLKLPRLMDGLWYVHVGAVDGAGNVSPAAHYPLRVVTRPPHARLKPLPTLGNSRKIRLEWEADEGVVGVAVGVREGGRQEWTVLVEKAEGRGREVEVAGEGVFEFSVRAYDGYGRHGLWEQGQVTLVDVAPPLEIPGVEAAPLPGGRIRLSWEPSWDELSGLKTYRVLRSRKGEIKWEPVAEIAVLLEDTQWTDECEGAPDGARFLYTVWPVDAAGNVLEQGPVAEAVCDRTAPPPRLVARTHPDPAKFYPARRVEVLWDCDADATGIAGIVVELDAIAATVPNPDALPARADRTLVFELPEDGRWYLHARAVDHAGNASETVHLSLQVDTRVDPPTAAFAQDPFIEWQGGGGVTVLIRPPEDASGVPAFWWILDQMPGTIPDRLTAKRVATTTLKVTPNADGMWYVHVVAEDGAGNLSAPVHLSMRLSTGLPMPRITRASHPEGLWSQKREVELTWEAVEGQHVGYLFWVSARRSDDPPPGAVRTEEPRCRLTMDEGISYLHICAADDVGRRSAAVAYQLRVDATPPELHVHCPSHPKGRWSSKRRVSYALETGDAHSGIARVELTLVPAGARPELWELALGTEGERDVPGEGRWTLWARATDLAGNASPLVSWEIQVDLAAAPPGLGSPTHPEGIWSPETKAEVWLLPGEDLSGVAEYAVALFQSGEEIPVQPPADAQKTAEERLEVALPGDGRWTLAAWATDLAGNLSAASRATLLCDTRTTEPGGFVVEPAAEGGWIRAGDVQAFWQPPEEPSGPPRGYWWVIDGAATTLPDPAKANYAAMAELEAGALPDGPRWLHVRTQDAAGNLSADAAHVKMSIDGTPPDFSLEVPEAKGGGWTKGRRATVQVHGEDKVSGFTGCLWTLHAKGDVAPPILEGRWKEEPEWVVEIPGDGEWIITAAAMDGAGNVAEPKQAVVRVDAGAHPPAGLASPTHPDPAAWYPARKIELRWDAVTDASGVKGYRHACARDAESLGDPAGWDLATGPAATRTVPEDGAWLLAVATEDGVGNISAPAHFAVRVDSAVEAPRLSSATHPKPDVWYADGAVAVRVLAEDHASGLARVLAAVSASGTPDPRAFKPVEGSSLALTLEKGAWWVHAVAVDRAGNVSPPASLLVRVDPAVRPPLVTCESHPDPEKWYADSKVKFSIMPAAGAAARPFVWLLDDQPDTQPAGPKAVSASPGPLEISVDYSGEWWLHVMTAADGESVATEAAHVRVRVDVTAPEEPVVTSKTHPPAPRRLKARDVELTWEEPKDVSGVKGYAYTLSKPGLLGTKTAKTATTAAKSVKFAGMEPGVWEFAVTATDKSGQTGGPGRYQFIIADHQDLCVAVRSESWKVARENVEVSLSADAKQSWKSKTGPNGESWFKEKPYGTYHVSIALPKPNHPLEFDGVDFVEGEPHMRLEATLAGCGWMICKDEIRLWVPEMWLDGGRIEVVDERNKAKGVHPLKGLESRGYYLVCPLPDDLLTGGIQLLGGPLNKLQWPVLTFTRPPLR